MHKFAVFLLLAFVAAQAEEVELKLLPLDSTSEIITKTGVRVNKYITADGNGSLQIRTDGPAVIQLFETGDIDIENAQLIYRAKLRTAHAKGDVYLEMWCRFPGGGEYSSRGLQYALSGTMGWNSVETTYFLRKGENPDNVRLNLVIGGKAIVWVDEVRLVKGDPE